MPSTKEEFLKAALSAFKTKEVSIGSATVTVRELSQPERDALDKSNYQMTPDGEFVTKPGEDGDKYLVPVEEKKSQYLERWIVATIEPPITVEEAATLPLSVRRMLCEEAKVINGIGKAEDVAKNS